VFFWAKMWGSGDDHGHRDRIIDSKVVSSEQLASLYLMYKDHKKEKGSTRPVVTGYSSNTKGFSNSVSDLLESVNKAKEEAYMVVSGEDMLAKVEKYNVEAEERKREGRKKLSKKMKCRGRGVQRKTEGM
jgi:phosphomevalonate kinase